MVDDQLKMSLKCVDDLFFFLGCSFVLCFLFVVVVVLPLAVSDALCVDSNSGVAFIGANTGASFCDASILIQLEQPIALWEGQ